MAFGLIGDSVGKAMKFVDGLPSYMRPNPAFRSRKAAQACAYFAAKADKGMDKLKVVKLLYLAERMHLASYHAGMVWDDLFSLKNGPVPSSTLNGIDGNIHPEVWDEYLGKHGNKRFAARQLVRDDFDELSNAELRTLEAIWQEHGHRSAGQLVEYTHKECAEYTETDGRRVPIRYEDLLVAVGLPKDDAMQVMADLEAWRQAEAVLHS